MASTTPTSHRRSASRNHPPSRPTTPLRPTSRSSFRGSTSTAAPHGLSSASAPTPLEALEPQFAELSDSMADLEANMMHLQLMHESLSRFSESFASFLYGLNMNAFCVDFPEAPIPDSFRRAEQQSRDLQALTRSLPNQPRSPGPAGGRADPDATFLTTDTSFIEHPPSSKASKYATPAAARTGGIPAASRGGAPGRGRARGSGIPSMRGTRGRGVGRGMTRG
ncbi:hypothetical protein K490DRAFT_48915 [Saccharata proteae CBS 121410]|uniref:DASH complex subunit DAM1 n=1 Tax=Saccharata proteae CBS 121410 TaxID=1314787 RepID=A0A9P4LVZ2_9PEZI|nr:hypothetical protein K490DRAFT_48915 [Saccharata proteae CBS 121410]